MLEVDSEYKDSSLYCKCEKILDASFGVLRLNPLENLKK